MAMAKRTRAYLSTPWGVHAFAAGVAAAQAAAEAVQRGADSRAH